MLSDTNLRNIFWYASSGEIKVKISKLDSNKLETIASEAKYQQNEMQTKWENILGSGISDKRLIFKIYKELIELNLKKKKRKKQTSLFKSGRGFE